MGKQSSAKKIARAQKAGGRTKVRSSQGLVFPIALGVVVVLGLALVFYARGSQQAADASEPLVGQRWHAAYGFYDCGTWLPNLANQKDDIEGTSVGINSFADGVIHVHPFTSQAAGTNADTGVFFDVLGIEMTKDAIKLPEDPALASLSEEQRTLEAGEDCQGESAAIKALVWEDANGTADPKVYVTDFDNIRFANDRMAIAFVRVPDNISSDDLAELRPPSIPVLDELNDVNDPSLPGETVPTTIIDGTIVTVPRTTAAPSTETTATGATTTAPTTTAASPTTTGG